MFQISPLAPAAEPAIVAPVKPKKRAKRTVLPKRFLKALRRLPRGTKWFEEAGEIRLEYKDDEFCPLTWACKAITDIHYDTGDFTRAADYLGIGPKVAGLIAAAADNDEWKGDHQFTARKLMAAREELLIATRLKRGKLD